jgi:NADH-quinone oxidoreductase subunit E
VAYTNDNLQRAREIIARYPSTRSAVLPLLHLAQDQDGWVSGDAITEVAALLGLTRADVFGTCSFYTMFKREPVGRLVVSVCTNVSCLVTGGPEVLEHLERRYGDEAAVHVEEVECLAACGGAPALQVNYEFHEHMTPATAERIVDDYLAGRLTARGVSGGRV